MFSCIFLLHFRQVRERVRQLDVLLFFLFSFFIFSVNLLRILDGLLLNPAFDFNRLEKINSSNAMVKQWSNGATSYNVNTIWLNLFENNII